MPKKTPDKDTCSDCGTDKDVDRVETSVNVINLNGPPTFGGSTLRYLCKPCQQEHFSGRMTRLWAPQNNVSQARLDWLAEARPLLDAPTEAKGRHLLKLLPPDQTLDDPDLLGAVDGFPFTIFGSNLGGTNYFDLGALIRSWAHPNGFSEDCPHCLGKGSLHVFCLSGSLLSGDAYWSGICRTCDRVISRRRDAPSKGLSYWTGFFGRAKAEIGRSLLIKRRGL